MTLRSKLILPAQTKSVTRICREILSGLISFQDGVALCRSTKDVNQLMRMLILEVDNIDFDSTPYQNEEVEGFGYVY